MAFNNEPNALNPDAVKCGTKGIPHNQNLELEAFLGKLYGHADHKVKLTALRLDKHKVMSRITQIKKGLTDLFVKFNTSPKKYNPLNIFLDKNKCIKFANYEKINGNGIVDKDRLKE